jgi:hypothetical protein
MSPKLSFSFIVVQCFVVFLVAKIIASTKICRFFLIKKNSFEGVNTEIIITIMNRNVVNEKQTEIKRFISLKLIDKKCHSLTITV